MLWKEFRMLLGNDAVEGSDVTQLAEADRVFLLLKGHMRRMREQLGVAEQPEREMERVTVGPEFQAQLAQIWSAYLPIQQALAADDAAQARQALPQLDAALSAIEQESLTKHAQQIWNKEQANMTRILGGLRAANDIQSLRGAFKPLSENIGVLARTFGFGQRLPVYELHCPMAFEGKGGTWYQDNDQTRNPYYGSTMLQCADRVDLLEREEPAKIQETPLDPHGGHEQHSHP